jgi:hypothetical protein
VLKPLASGIQHEHPFHSIVLGSARPQPVAAYYIYKDFSNIWWPPERFERPNKPVATMVTSGPAIVGTFPQYPEAPLFGTWGENRTHLKLVCNTSASPIGHPCIVWYVRGIPRSRPSRCRRDALPLSYGRIICLEPTHGFEPSLT